MIIGLNTWKLKYLALQSPENDLIIAVAVSLVMQYSLNLQPKTLACPILPSSTRPTKRNFTKTVSASNVQNPHVQAMWEPLRADSYTMQVIKAKLNVLSTICIIDSQN